MIKQICFAGFASSEVESLQTAGEQMNPLWDCVFVPDGAGALALMETVSFAALIAELRMENLGAVSLLEQAAVKHPRTLRFALGDVTDRELVAGSIGATYQFLSRPWRLSDLISIIERSLSLDAWLSDDKLRSFLPQLGRLPGLPSTYFEIVKRAESSNASIESIAEIIARDPTLTARLLQTVNSPACGLAEKVTRPADAVSALGLEAVKSLVLCLQVFDGSSRSERSSISLDDLWRHSFAVAQMASRIALQETDDPCTASECYTAGLLHRIGQIILATNLSQRYSKVISGAREHQRSLPQEECIQLDVTSNQVGAYLLGIWGMPLPLVEATALFHNPSVASAREFSPLTAVHVADVLVGEARPLCADLPGPQLQREYLEALGLPTSVEGWRKALTKSQKSRPSPGRDRRQAPVEKPAPKPVFQNHRFPHLAKVGVVLASLAAMILLLSIFSLISKKLSTSTALASQTPPAFEPLSPLESSKERSALDSIKVEAIFYRAGQPVALINGKTVGRGGQVNGANVLSINPASVVLGSAGEQRTFTLK